MEHLNGFERNDFCDFDKPRKRPIKKEGLSPTSKARREASRNEFMEKGEMPDKVESFQEKINSRQVHPRAQPGFVKSI